MIECCGKKRVFEVNDLYLEPSSPHQNAIKLDRDTVVFSLFSRAGLGSKIVKAMKYFIALKIVKFIFLEGHKILRNLHRRFVLCYQNIQACQSNIDGDFLKNKFKNKSRLKRFNFSPNLARTISKIHI